MAFLGSREWSQRVSRSIPRPGSIRHGSANAFPVGGGRGRYATLVHSRMSGDVATPDRSASDFERAHADDRSDAKTPNGRQSDERSCGLLLTLFIAYHLVALFVANLPSQGPTRGLHWIFEHYGDIGLYLDSTGSFQNWTLFGPDVPRTNQYMRVFVHDQSGGVTDLRHDTYGRQQYPYLRFDYRRTLNFRVAVAPAYRRGYAAWVCRTWEATHGGQPAREVHFVQ